MDEKRERELDEKISGWVGVVAQILSMLISLFLAMHFLKELTGFDPIREFQRWRERREQQRLWDAYQREHANDKPIRAQEESGGNLDVAE